MSFLYQALIKDKPKSQQELATHYEQTQSAGFYGQNFAPEQKSSTSLWLVIGALLLIVGVLGGFILGQQKNAQSEPLNSTTEKAAILQALLDAQAKQEQGSSIPVQIQTVNTAAPIEKTVEESEPVEPKVTVEPQIEVAVDDDGKVKTQVKGQEPAQSNELVEQPEPIDPEQTEQLTSLNVNQTPELSLEEIPEELKSSFAEALKATEESVEPNLFESHVNTGSSLALITELPANQMFLLPDIEYQMHIFASEPSERWIRINGQTLLEGEPLNNELTLIEIRQEQIIWQYKERRFAQNALEDFVKRDHL